MTAILCWLQDIAAMGAPRLQIPKQFPVFKSWIHHCSHRVHLDLSVTLKWPVSHRYYMHCRKSNKTSDALSAQSVHVIVPVCQCLNIKVNYRMIVSRSWITIYAPVLGLYTYFFVFYCFQYVIIFSYYWRRIKDFHRIAQTPEFRSPSFVGQKYSHEI